MDKTALIKILETAKSGGQRVEVNGCFYAGQGSTRRVGLVQSIDSKANNYTLYGSSVQGCLVLADRETLGFDKTETAELYGPPPPLEFYTIELPKTP